MNDIQSASGASVSNAGVTAIAEDASTIYYNAAGMTLLKRPEVLLASPIIALSNSFQDAGSVAPLGGPAIGLGGNKDEVVVLPSLFAALPLTDRLTVGLGLFVPFGQSNKYADSWVGRYQLQNISLATVDIDPAIAYRVSDELSVGGGVDIQYAHLKRRSAVDFGSLCFVLSNPANCPGAGLIPQGADGQFAADVEDWSVGYNLSLLYHLGDATHIGVNYRSAMRHSFSGDADFTVPAAAVPLAAGGQFQDTGVQANVTFPDVISVGLSQQIDDRMTVLADVGWTQWSRLKQVTLNFDNPVQPPQNLVFHWDDSFRFALGGIYKLTEETHLRAGASYEQSAVSDVFRSADLPDSDITMFSAGLEHRFDERLSAMISYSYRHYSSAAVNLSVPLEGTLVGTFHRSSNAVGLQVRLQL